MPHTLHTVTGTQNLRGPAFLGNGLICCSLRDGQHTWWHFKQSLAACELEAAVPWASSTMNCTQPSFNPAPPHLPQPYMASLLCMYFGKLCSSSLDFFFWFCFFQIITNLQTVKLSHKWICVQACVVHSLSVRGGTTSPLSCRASSLGTRVLVASHILDRPVGCM